MIYDRNGPTGTLPSIFPEEPVAQASKDFWRRLFLLPSKAGVQLAAQRRTIPLPTLRQQPRLVYQALPVSKVIDLVPVRVTLWNSAWERWGRWRKGMLRGPSSNNSRQGKIAYIHLRNVIGKAPHYRELHRRRRRRYDTRPVDPEAQRFQRCYRSRPHPADELCGSLACGDGPHPGLRSGCPGYAPQSLFHPAKMSASVRADS